MKSNPGQIPSRNAGFSAIQVVVTVTLVLILSAVSVKPLSGLINRIRLQNAADGMKHMLLNARTRAISSPDRHCGIAFRLHASNSPHDDSLIAFLDANPPDNQYVKGQDAGYLTPHVIPRKQGIYARIPWGYPSEVIFRGDGSATSSAKVILTLKGFTDTVDVLASTGRVKVIKK